MASSSLIVRLALLPAAFALATTAQAPAMSSGTALMVPSASSTGSVMMITGTPSSTVSPSSTTTGIASSTSSTANAIPSNCTDNQPGCPAVKTESSHSNLVQYYYIFLALIVAVAGLCAFLVWRKKRRARQWAHSGREDALANDVSAWGDTSRQRRRYWQGRWRSADISREEGLNEHGEAPPPYMPKTQEEEAAERRVGRGSSDSAADMSSLAVPMQTLSREDAGLKPPDYTEAHVRTVDSAGRPSSARMSRDR